MPSPLRSRLRRDAAKATLQIATKNNSEWNDKARVRRLKDAEGAKGYASIQQGQDGKMVFVDGRCPGKRGEAYIVRIKCNRQGSRVESFSCTCVGGTRDQKVPCKHALAVILKQSEKDSRAPTQDPIITPSSAIPSPAVSPATGDTPPPWGVLVPKGRYQQFFSDERPRLLN